MNIKAKVMTIANALVKQGVSRYKAMIVDDTECPVERPQKNKENGTPAKRKDIR